MLALGLVLSGCSAVQFSYNQAPTLAYWWLDRYAGFTDQQSPQVKVVLAQWFAWHRRTQLLPYADTLAQTQRQMSGPIDAGLVCGQWAEWQQRLTLASQQALPAAARLARTLDAEQLAQMEKHQAKQLEQARRDYLQPTAAERQQAMFERHRKRAEDLYGDLDAAQQRLLRDGVAASPFDAERWLAVRRGRQQALLRQLRQWQARSTDATAAEDGLKRLVADMVQPAGPEDQAYQRRVTEANCAMAARLHNSTSPTQRQKAVAKLRGWEMDLRALASQMPDA